jgi:hypothetical protein
MARRTLVTLLALTILPVLPAGIVRTSWGYHGGSFQSKSFHLECSCLGWTRRKLGSVDPTVTLQGCGGFFIALAGAT